MWSYAKLIKQDIIGEETVYKKSLLFLEICCGFFYLAERKYKVIVPHSFLFVNFKSNNGAMKCEKTGQAGFKSLFDTIFIYFNILRKTFLKNTRSFFKLDILDLYSKNLQNKIFMFISSCLIFRYI